jgi:general secretion pathway protein F
MQFEVRALTDDNMMRLLTVVAQDEADARRQIESRGLFAASVHPLSSSRFGVAGAGKKGAGRLSLVLFSQELLALLNAGLSIVESLEALLEKEASESSRSILTCMLTGLREGKRFSSVLAEQADLFPPLYVGIVQAAEGTGDLPRSLTRFIDYQLRIDVVRNKIISASIYPLILMCVGGGVSFFLIGYIVPRFSSVYEGGGHNLPWMSQMLLNFGQFVSNHAVLLLIAIGSGLATLFLTMRQLVRSGRLALLIARIPGIGERVRIYELSRLYLTLGMLIEGGIPIVAAMDTVHGMVSANIRQRLQATRNMVESGMMMSAGFEANNLTTPISLRMLRVGERTGEMGQMLTQSAAFYDGEISRWIDRFTRAFEPLLMMVIGIVIGVIVVLLYMPIFDLAGSMS